MPNPISKLLHPWYPATALGLEKGLASVVELERHGNAGGLRRAATVKLHESLISPSFEEANIEDHTELAAALRELAASAGLLKQKRWSVSLPEATARTLILTLEPHSGSGSELEEVLRWKMDRGFAVPLDELSISRERLAKDAQGFSILGWRAGLVLPRHMGESQWLTRNGFNGDSLLLSSTNEGFTAVVFRNKQPLIFRSIECDPDEREDELYRLLLFYRDRRAAESEIEQPLSRFLITGAGFDKARANEIVNETTGGDLRPLPGFASPERRSRF